MANFLNLDFTSVFILEHIAHRESALEKVINDLIWVRVGTECIRGQDHINEWLRSPLLLDLPEVVHVVVLLFVAGADPNTERTDNDPPQPEEREAAFAH
jgi:hypothetical protein